MKNYKSKILLFFCLLLFGYSIINIFNWFKDSNSIAKESENLLNTASTDINTNENSLNKENSANTTNAQSENETDTQMNAQTDTQTNAMDENVVSSSSINFSALEQINKDVVGWIQVDGTDINYPFVQTTDNSYYLDHSFSKEKNKSGWIFLDYRNNIDDFDKNTIIYGHSRYDSSMFGSLRNCIKKSWFYSSDTHEVHLTTKEGKTTWQIFSAYHIPNTNDYLATSFNTDEEFKSFIKLIKNRTVFDFGVKVTAKDKILTLSTCYRTNDRMVIHAKSK